MRASVLTALILALCACRREPPPGAAPPAPAAPTAMPGAPAMPGAMPAMPGVMPTMPGVPPTPQVPGAAPGAPPGAAAMQNAMQALAQLQAAQGQAGTAVVNWRALAPFVPDSLAGFTPEGELSGSSEGAMGMQVSRVRRSYRNGARTLRVEIVDSNMVPSMRAAFAMAGTVSEDSTEGVRRGTTVGGQQGLLEWRRANNRSKVDVLAGGRYIVNVEVQPASAPDEAVQVAGQLNLAGLAALR